jgi:membrane-associated phospholipid phosphatase
MVAMPELFYRLPQNVITIFKGKNWWWLALAVVLTIVIVTSGGDWSYHLLTQGPVFLQLAVPAMVVGGLLPIMGTLTLLLVGGIMRNGRIVTTAWALGQSAILGWLISSVCKAFTGRRPPPLAGHFRGLLTSSSPLVDSSHGFQFGLLKGGIFWGWPSSHTTVAFAMATCVVALFPHNRKLGWGAMVYAFYIGFGVSLAIHWLSEFVAGAIIGSVIGTTVGRSFKNRLE